MPGLKWIMSSRTCPQTNPELYYSVTCWLWGICCFRVSAFGNEGLFGVGFRDSDFRVYLGLGGDPLRYGTGILVRLCGNFQTKGVPSEVTQRNQKNSPLRFWVGACGRAPIKVFRVLVFEHACMKPIVGSSLRFVLEECASVHS